MKKILRVWLVLIVLSTGVYSCLPLYPYGYSDYGYSGHEYRGRGYRDHEYRGQGYRNQGERNNGSRDGIRNQREWNYHSPDV